jgi:hypothetical protein
VFFKLLPLKGQVSSEDIYNGLRKYAEKCNMSLTKLTTTDVAAFYW